MDPITIGLVIAALREGVGGVVRLIQLFQANKMMNEEEAKKLLDRIKSDANISDTEWDDAVAQARARVGGGD